MAIYLPNKIKRGLKIIGITLGLVCALKTVDASITSNLPVSKVKDTFPASYQSYIDKLKKTYPNATFKAVYTGLNWNTVVKHESYEVKTGISLIPDSYPDTWKKDGKDIYKDGYFVVASKGAVAYLLDPRNSLYEKYIFQFEGLTYNSAITTSVIEKVIGSSPMVGTYAKKYKKSGKWIDMDMSYAEIIDKVGKEQGVSSVYIASRMIQETSGDIVNNGSIYGSNKTYPGVYNFFNIGATPNSDGTGAVTNGLKYAKAQGWTTPYLSISGGVKEIKSSYIVYGQDTIYFQKFDVNNPYGNAKALMAYQYQTNIMAPTSESIISYNAYKKLDMLDTAFTFYIPVYNNMPEDPAPYPAGDTAKFVSDNTKVYLDDEIKNGTDVFNIRSSASSELDNIIYTVTEKKEGNNNRTVMTRTKKGNGYDWDYVEFTVDGKTIKGYVWNEYVQEYDYTKVTSVVLDKTEITLEIGSSDTLTATINPANAKYKNVTWSVEDSSIVSVNKGKLTANKIGTTTVTVTSDDQSKIATCKVIVTDKIPQITTDKEEYTVTIDEMVKPEIILKHIEDCELKVKDETIACIVDGNIKGLKVGETELEIIAKGVELTKTVKIIVKEKPTEGYTLDESLNETNKIITNVSPKTLVSKFKEKIELLNLSVSIKDINDKNLKDTANIGTGTTVTFLKSDNTEYDKLTVIICGDVTGDGLINSADLLKTVRYLKGTTKIDKNAADVTKDGKIDSADLLKTVRYLKGTTKIDFS